MFRTSGYLLSGEKSRGLVRKACTSNLLSLLMKVKGATSASFFPPRTLAFRSVSFLEAAAPDFRNNCGVSERPMLEYAIAPFLLTENENEKPGSDMTACGVPPLMGKR